MTGTSSKPKLRGERNLYATQCLDCGGLSPPDSGQLYQKVNGHWFIRCDACAAKDEIEPKSRIEQRKAAWREFRKRVTTADDRPPWGDFLALWRQCRGFDDDCRSRIEGYREQWKANAPFRAEAKRKREEEAEERSRKLKAEAEDRDRKWEEAHPGVKLEESWEARQEQKFRQWMIDEPTAYAIFCFWCVDFGKDADNRSWFQWLDPHLRAMWEDLHRLIQERKGMPDVSCLAALGLTPPVTVEAVKAAFRQKAKATHPDHGGDATAFVTLRSHYEHALRYAEA